VGVQGGSALVRYRSEAELVIRIEEMRVSLALGALALESVAPVAPERR
jgi:hypothetical protein